MLCNSDVLLYENIRLVAQHQHSFWWYFLSALNDRVDCEAMFISNVVRMSSPQTQFQLTAGLPAVGKVHCNLIICPSSTATEVKFFSVGEEEGASTDTKTNN